MVVDKSTAYYLGGYHQSNARDRRINDNFTAFALKTTTEVIKVDGVEVKEGDAAWFDKDDVLKQFLAFVGDKPMSQVKGNAELTCIRYDADGNTADSSGKAEKFDASTLKWLHSYINRNGMECVVTRDIPKDDNGSGVVRMKLAIG